MRAPGVCELSEVEAKIMKWLKEEKFSPTSKESPGAYFHIEAKVGNLVLNVIHGTYFMDSLEVIIGFIYNEDQLTLLNTLMDEDSKKRYYNSVHLELQRHPFVWDYSFNYDDSFLTLLSKRLYYDSLTKDSFMHLFLFMAKFFRVPMTLLQPYFWEFWPGYVPPTPENNKEPLEGR